MNIIRIVKIFLIVLVLSLFLLNNIFSQNSQVDSDINAVFFPQGYVLESISGYGYSTATSTSISNINVGNPASLIDFNKFSIGISVQLESDIKEAWIAQIGHKRIDNDLPQSYGFVFPVRNFRIGYGFSQRYNTQLDFGKLEIRTVSQPEGTGEFIIPIHKTYVTMNSFFAAFSIRKENAVLSIGIQYAQNKLNHYQEIYRSYFSHSDKKDSWAVGLRYDKPTKYQFGIFYENRLKFKKLTTISYYDVPDSISETVGNISGSFYVVGDFPSKFHLGLTYQIFANMQLVGNSTYVFWNNISKSYKNQIELSVGTLYRLNRITKLLAGIFNTNRRYNEGSLLNGEKRLNAIYITSGLILRLWMLEIELTVADSHLFSGEWRKQTIGKLGIGIRL